MPRSSGGPCENPRASAPVFARSYGATHGSVARRLGPSRRDDLASETFLVAFARRDQCDPAHADARPWLYGIASNLIARRQVPRRQGASRHG